MMRYCFLRRMRKHLTTVYCRLRHAKRQALHLKRQLHTTLVEAADDLQPHDSSSRYTPKRYTPRGRRTYINGLGILKKFEQEKEIYFYISIIAVNLVGN